MALSRERVTRAEADMAAVASGATGGAVDDGAVEWAALAARFETLWAVWMEWILANVEPARVEAFGAYIEAANAGASWAWDDVTLHTAAQLERDTPEDITRPFREWSGNISAGRSPWVFELWTCNFPDTVAHGLVFAELNAIYDAECAWRVARGIPFNSAEPLVTDPALVARHQRAAEYGNMWFLSTCNVWRYSSELQRPVDTGRR